MRRFSLFLNVRPARALLPVLWAASLLASFFLLLSSFPARALGEDVCSSGCTFSSIQAAIDAAASGDSITLAAETFTETLTITKSITLEGSGATIIQAANAPNLAAGRVITMSGNITVNLTDLSLRYGDTDYGGGLYIVSGAAALTNTQVLSNTAAFYGGGVYVDSITATLKMDGSEVRGNSADEGGGIYINLGSASLTNTQMLSNTVTSYGGGVEVFDFDASLVMSGGEVRGNSADIGGGIDITSGSAVLDNTQVSGNSASAGGGIYIYDCCANLSMNGGEVRGNSADEGGGIYVDFGSAILTNTQVLSNTATLYGGGINLFDLDAFLSMNGGEVRGNSADEGGGIFIDFGSAILTNTLVLNNTAASYGGGIEVYDFDAILFMSDSQVSGNSADIGGGIDVTSGIADLSNTQVLSNTAASDGGGIYVYDCCAILALSDSEVRGNSANFGGGVYITFGSAALSNTLVLSNSAASDGGGLYLEDISAFVQQNGGEERGNSAANGGAIYLNNGSISTLNGAAITGDVFQFDGSFDATLAPLVLDGMLTLQGGTFRAPSSFNLTGVFSHTGGAYQQTQTLTTGVLAGFPKVGGLVLTATVGSPGSTAVVIQAGIDCTSIAGEAVKHCYNITPTISAGVSMDADFYFNASEIPVLQTCNSLAVWHWNGAIWEAAGVINDRECVSSPKRVSVNGIDSFSPFAIRQDDAPTALGALALRARPAGPSPWLAALAGVLALVAFPLRKKAGTRTRRSLRMPG